jgi:hypothetical protein
MNEEQEREVEIKVRERLFDERMKRLDSYGKWMQRGALTILATAIGLVFVDNLVCCEAHRIVREELHK